MLQPCRPATHQTQECSNNNRKKAEREKKIDNRYNELVIAGDNALTVAQRSAAQSSTGPRQTTRDGETPSVYRTGTRALYKRGGQHPGASHTRTCQNGIDCKGKAGARALQG